ncbi:MAG: SUMF1/EgtB/PvdO family nonheme iron enzyme, partial [Prevotella sp.]|nr:SUMF1/EgtB/PvdO family nonheme iron enzyme [Prevotella sp.]
MKRKALAFCVMLLTIAITGCMGSKSASSSGRGGEVVGVGGKAFSEPTPYGMTRINRGWLRMGIETQDSLWGKQTPVKDVSIDGFWMDETEITNSQYKQFVNWVRDSILRTRLADPSYGGDETYMVTEDKNGDPIEPHLNWKKQLPRKPNEDEQRAMESLYKINPVTGEKLLDCSQLNYRYEVYDYTTAALRRNRLNPEERNLNTDMVVDPNEVVMISKDTAYIDDEGRIIRQTINRPLSGPWDFLNTYIVNIYP